MVNRIFYSDYKLVSLEETRRWFETIEYLEELYEDQKYFPRGAELLCSLLFQTWYFVTIAVDGPERYNVLPETDDVFDAWRHYLSQVIDLFIDNTPVCWIAGFTAINMPARYSKFKKIGEELIRFSKKGFTLDQPFDILMDKKRKDNNDIYYILPDELFPSKAMSDKYFKNLLLDKLKRFNTISSGKSDKN